MNATVRAAAVNLVDAADELQPPLSRALGAALAAMSADVATLTVHDDLGVRVGSLLRFKEKPVNNLIVVSGANPDTETYVLTLKPGAGTWRSLGIEIARDDEVSGKL